MLKVILLLVLFAHFGDASSSSRRPSTDDTPRRHYTTTFPTTIPGRCWFNGEWFDDGEVIYRNRPCVHGASCQQGSVIYFDGFFCFHNTREFTTVRDHTTREFTTVPWRYSTFPPRGRTNWGTASRPQSTTRRHPTQPIRRRTTTLPTKGTSGHDLTGMCRYWKDGKWYKDGAVMDVTRLYGNCEQLTMCRKGRREVFKSVGRCNTTYARRTTTTPKPSN